MILKDGEDMEPPGYTPILAARIGNINFDSVFTYEQKFSQISAQVIFIFSLSYRESMIVACHLLVFSCD